MSFLIFGGKTGWIGQKIVELIGIMAISTSLTRIIIE